MKKETLIKQHDITDCGAACLASVAAHYGLKIPISRIRQLASTNKKGTNVLGLLEAANALGLSAKATKAIDGSQKMEVLKKVPYPAIAHVVVKESLHHFVVIYEVSDLDIKVMDPADGKIKKYTPEGFEKEWTGVLVLLVPQAEFRPRNETVSVFRRLWFLLQPHASEMAQAVFGAMLYTIIGLATSVYVQKIVDYVIPDTNANLLNLLSVVMVVLLLVSVFISFYKTLFVMRIGMKIDARLILGYYKHLLTLPQSFFDNMRTGEIISRINDAVKIRVFINDTIIGFLVGIFILVFSFVMMFTYYWKLALIMLCIIPIYSIIYLAFNYANQRTQRRLMENSADLESHLVESINAAGTIKRFGMESFANIKTEMRFVKLLGTIYQSGKNSLWASSGVETFSRLFTIILLWAGTYFVLEKQITPGELLSFYALIAYFTGPLGDLISMNKTIQDARIAAHRLFEIMDIERESEEEKVQLSADNIGKIAFEQVDFRYGSRADVFKKLDLVFQVGKMSAVVGESGSGKSTLMAILQNIYPIQAGRVSIGGLDVRHISNASLRQVVSVVPQKIDLFDGTILENIALGDFSPEIKTVVDICKSIGLLDFIDTLPKGFYTPIGENGSQLSGGQRQRLAIARALYRNPQILILDEATSALDSESELYIKQMIATLKSEGKTVIVIAHRLGTIVHADEIFVLHQGALVEQGTHLELIAQQKQYAQYWHMQTQTI